MNKTWKKAHSRNGWAFQFITGATVYLFMVTRAISFVIKKEFNYSAFGSGFSAICFSISCVLDPFFLEMK